MWVTRMARSESQNPSLTLFLLFCPLFAVSGATISQVARARNLNDIFDPSLHFKLPHQQRRIQSITQSYLF